MEEIGRVAHRRVEAGRIAQAADAVLGDGNFWTEPKVVFVGERDHHVEPVVAPAELNYDQDPLGRLGMLQAAMFRAARCVVDTGLHAKGWSRERAIDYMVATTGQNRLTMTSEVERYCTWPGQATSYKVGQTRWLKLRSDARERLGEKFDIRDFHDVGLGAAPMPLSVLERVVDEWLKGRGV